MDGPVELDGSSSFVRRRDGQWDYRYTVEKLDNALFNSSFVRATSGSTVNFTTGGPEVFNLSLTGAVANFSFAGGDPFID